MEHHRRRRHLDLLPTSGGRAGLTRRKEFTCTAPGPALQGGAFALSAAALFGISTPLVQRAGAGLRSFTTAALLYGGAAFVGALLRRPVDREAAPFSLPFARLDRRDGLRAVLGTAHPRARSGGARAGRDVGPAGDAPSRQSSGCSPSRKAASARRRAGADGARAYAHAAGACRARCTPSPARPKPSPKSHGQVARRFIDPLHALERDGEAPPGLREQARWVQIVGHGSHVSDTTPQRLRTAALGSPCSSR